MVIFRLALRNLFRQVARNLVSMASIVLGVFIIVLGTAFVSGMEENMIRAQIDTISGHLFSVPKDYPTAGLNHPVDNAYSLTQEDRDWLDNTATAWTPRIMASPRLVFGLDSIRVRLIGYDPVSDPTVFPRTQWSIDGEYPENDPEGVIVGTGLADLLDLTIGSPIVLESRTVDGAMNAGRFHVTGIVRTGAPVVDSMGVLAPLDRVGALVVANDRITHLNLRIFDRDQTAQVAAELGQQLGDRADPLTWQEETKSLVEAQSIRKFMVGFLGVALFAMAAAGIANTVLMAAFERIREIGTLRALGMRRSGVITMFAYEGLGLGLVGGTLGAVSAGALVWYWSSTGIDLSALIEGRQDIGNLPLSTMLYITFSPSVILAAIVLAVIVAVLASLYPANMAARQLPAEAVRAE